LSTNRFLARVRPIALRSAATATTNGAGSEMLVLDKPYLLKQHEFFADMPAPTIAKLAARLRILSFRQGERIFSKGDAGAGLLAVLSGLVRISVPSEGKTELTLRLIEANEVFGEVSLLDGQPRTADATAAMPCRLLSLERRDLLAVLLSDPAAAVTLLRVVSLRLRRTSEQLQQASFGPMSSRLAQALLAVARASPGDSASAGRICMSQREIGNLVGLSRETTNRHLRAWRRSGIIALHDGAVVICDAKALAALGSE
jgi:CRP/FNR family transcriptional regulator, cyclic AMP receptor protein